MRKIKPKTEKYMTDRVSTPKESKPIYPTIRLDLEHIPEAKDWKVGKEYTIEMKVKMTGISQSRFDNSAEFEIHEIETEDENKEGDSEESDEQ